MSSSDVVRGLIKKWCDRGDWACANDLELALAQRAEAVAVGEIRGGASEPHSDGKFMYYFLANRELPKGTELYLAPPPAAPEGMVPPEMAISASGIRSSGMYVKGWNDCREAMLAASAKPQEVGRG